MNTAAISRAIKTNTNAHAPKTIKHSLGTIVKTNITTYIAKI
jgi:hypothetical protein